MSETQRVECANCGTIIEEPANTPVEDRKPCPKCGSTSRNFHVTVSDSLSSSPVVQAAVSQIAASSPGDVQQTAAAQIAILESYHSNGLAQARRSFNVALVAAGVGLIFFVAAVAFLLITQAASVAVPAAVITALGGALVEVVAGINFVLYSKATAQLATFYQYLDQTQRFLLANNICESLEGETKQTARASLINTIANSKLSP